MPESVDREYLAMSLAFLGMAEFAKRMLAKRLSKGPLADELDDLCAELLADGKNTVCPDGISAEDEAYAVGKALENMRGLFEKWRADVRKAENIMFPGADDKKGISPAEPDE